MPEGCGLLWQHFLTLDRWRAGGGMSMAPLTLDQLERYERRYGVTFSPAEDAMLKALDFARLGASLPSKAA